jgi:alkanesulfonate monooxygenase SsuD/methylene tetrahydromethanopterin reductase-like flavin-dependent oxidoreductase (luciferase family)
MLRLAAAEAGIAITNWLAPSDVPKVRAAAGPDCELVARIFVCPTTDAGTARMIGRRMIAAYLTVPVYAAFQQWLGRGDIIEPLLTAWNSGDRKAAVEAIPDALVDDLVIHGPAEQCRERVAEYQAAGLDTPVILILPVPGLDLAGAISKLAPA